MIGDNKKVEFTLDELDEISCVLVKKVSFNQ